MHYKFSIVMAVYNVAPFLREAIGSVIAQDIGFQHVQLILVDDGSNDGSGAICDEYAAKYPDNILALHKENGGVSSARNLGLEHVQGEYVNFLDSDDKLSRNALRKIYAFFKKHHEETDIVAIPLFFFDAQTGEHLLNDKFKKGSRVINLQEEWQTAQLHIASSFVKRSVITELYFDTRLSYAEDAKYVQQILSAKQTLGVISDAIYLYRKRTSGEASAIQSCQIRKSWYLPCIYYFHQDTITYYLEQAQHLPRFTQYTLMYDLQWRFRQSKLPMAILSEDEKERYRKELWGILDYIEDDVILSQKELSPIYKAMLLMKKRTSTVYLSCCLDFLTWKKESLLLEGRIPLPPEDAEMARVKVLVNSHSIPCERFECKNQTLITDEPIVQDVGFRVDIPYPNSKTKMEISFAVYLNGTRIMLDQLQFGKFFPVGNLYQYSYCIKNGWNLTVDGSKLRMVPVKWWHRIVREPAYLAEIWKTNAHGGRKSLPVRIAYPFLKLLKRKPLWLISDRINHAGDNGEALFRYIREHHPECDVRFVLSKKCPGYHALQKIGPVLGFRSLHHRFIAPLADFAISSQGEGIFYNPFDGYSEPYRDLFMDTKFIFLQHGITQNDLSAWINRYDKNLHGFVTSTVPEKNSIISAQYHYTEDQVWLTGFPRFDRLYHDEQKIITIMPTWRRYLMDRMDTQTGRWSCLPDFNSSTYARFYTELLNNRKLLDSAINMGYRIAFFSHPIVRPHFKLSPLSDAVIILAQDTDYRDIYAHSNLVITDYSSAVFDFAYLRKPVIYTQFDTEQFFSGKHPLKRGYFDYERDGFGEVEHNLEGTVDRIIEYMENGCQLKDKYRQRIDSFFAFHDRNNCQRVFEKILELDKKDT